MTIGERIKNRRIELGMTQTELSKKMGYSGKSTICKTETGGDNLTTTKVKKYAEALNCSFGYLMGWEELEKEEAYSEGIELGELIKKYNQLTPEGKLAVISLIDSLLSMSK